MASGSPSEFLTFYRRIASSSTLRYSTVSRTTSRPFTSSLQSRKQQDIGKPDKKKSHTLEKEHEPNVQTKASKEGRSERAKDQGGAATSQKDPNDAAKKAKEEFPEAPTTIGFQDERGGKGH